MTSFVFIGDSHLGYRHRFRVERLRDYERAFNEAVDKALRLNPDAVVFMGDLLHHPRPDPVSLRTLLNRLISVACSRPVVVCIGNHEIEGHIGTTYAPIYGDLHENIHVLSSENPHVVLDIRGRSVGFHGFEFIRSREMAEQKLKELAAGAKADVNILCLHQAVERYLSPHELSLAALRHAAPSYDLIVLGHVHKHQPIREVSDVTPAFYCGSTERISFNEAANPNGFMLFRDDFRKPEFVPVNSAGMAYVREELTGTPDEANQKIEELIAANPQKLLKIELTADLLGDFMDIRRDWSAFEQGRTILEVNVTPKSAAKEASLERVELNEDTIREYFEKSGNASKEQLEVCLELFRKYGA